ncbi:hypothetical protein tinsulaeT_12000 [Thalassotalea insulae]|uniref:Type 4 fimbrial biogenesis protein PilX N-terminal domain-containing protein n=2 Tax=Thalassotalea insulae TaxID=2056778 RepID=A0ABQ6GTS9_9GAMM|nr:hypothetical protein tinsulaeT_12000 [Thalassotalea insulae]
MCHNELELSFLPKKVTGSALVIAIFIIVVMSLIGTALVKTLSTSGETIVYEVLGTRAFQAAQTGLQFKLQKLFPLNDDPKTCEAISPVTKPILTNTEGLENCSIASWRCDSDLVINGIRYYIVSSTGQCEVDGVFTSRTVEVQAREL